MRKFLIVIITLALIFPYFPKPVFASWDHCVDFRASAGYVTDPPPCDNDEGASSFTSYPNTYPSGMVAGWASGTILFTQSRDRNSSGDARIAGIVFTNGSQVIYEVDLPSAGQYDISLGVGDGWSSNNVGLINIDDGIGGSHLITINHGPVGDFYDATDTQYTGAAWPVSETPVTVTFTGTHLSLTVDTVSGIGVIDHLRMTQVGGATPKPCLLGLLRVGTCE
jgi:hypothetical protein